MRSLTSSVPMGSLTRTSTFSGSVTSSTLPRTTRTTSSMPGGGIGSMHPMQRHCNGGGTCIGSCKLRGILRHSRGFHCVHDPGACLRCKQRQDAAASANITHCLPLKIDAVVENGSIVGASPYKVLEHVLLMLQHAVLCWLVFVLVRLVNNDTCSTAMHART